MHECIPCALGFEDEFGQLPDGAAAAGFLAGGEGRIVAVNDRQEAAFRRAAAERALAVRELGTVAGLNYVRGRQVALSLFKVE